MRHVVLIAVLGLLWATEGYSQTIVCRTDNMGNTVCRFQ
jgi:hypothetical protein